MEWEGTGKQWGKIETWKGSRAAEINSLWGSQDRGSGVQMLHYKHSVGYGGPQHKLSVCPGCAMKNGSWLPFQAFPTWMVWLLNWYIHCISHKTLCEVFLYSAMDGCHGWVMSLVGCLKSWDLALEYTIIYSKMEWTVVIIHVYLHTESRKKICLTCSFLQLGFFNMYLRNTDAQMLFNCVNCDKPIQ